MKNGLLAMAAALTMGTISITPAQANTYTFAWITPTNQNTVLGPTYSETVDGMTLTALALTSPTNLTQPSTNSPDLYAQDGGSGDTGLGLSTSNGGNPGMINDGIQVDFANALATSPGATVSMTISGLQSGDSWAIYGSNTKLTVAGPSKSDRNLGEPLVSGTDTGAATATVTLPDWGQYTYYTLMSTGAPMCDTASILLDDVVVNGGTTTTTKTPEPGGLLLAGTALIAIGVLLKKARKS